VTILFSDRGIPASYRHVHGFGSHTYSFINAAGERVWTKFHFRNQQGIQNLTDDEASATIASDRESHQRDLFEAIKRGEFPKWTLCVQVMTEAGSRPNYWPNSIEGAPEPNPAHADAAWQLGQTDRRSVRLDSRSRRLHTAGQPLSPVR